MDRPTLSWMGLLLLCSHAGAQNSFPFREGFDSVAAPALPPGWVSSQNRSTGVNDFTSTTSTPRSAPNALISTNATIAQDIATPVVSFESVLPETLSYFVRRSSSHTARVVVEASLDGGVTYPVCLGDTLRGTASTSYLGHRVALAGSITGVSGVRFRWRIIPEPGGATGTFRLDDITITARIRHDMAIDTIRVDPPLPVEGAPAEVLVSALNNGLDSVGTFALDLFLDRNNDSVAQASELFAVLQAPAPLGPGDRSLVRAPLPALGYGEILCVAHLTFAPDQNAANNDAVVPISIGVRRGSVVINELMYAPASPGPEWIEVMNIRDSAITLRRWAVADAGGARRIITETGLPLAPGGSVVLTRDTSALRAAYPGIPGTVVLVPSLPSLNNSGDIVVLFDDRGATVDSLQYAPGWGGSDGRSLERRDGLGSPTDSANWGASEDSLGATPGRPNSIVLLDQDLRFVRLVPSATPPGRPMPIAATVLNAGRETSGPFGMLVYQDLDGDSAAAPAEHLCTIPVGDSVVAGDSIVVEGAWDSPPPGAHLMIAVLSYPPDLRPGNNIIRAAARVGFPVRALVINEIMFEPAPGGAEYVEFFNGSQEPVDLSGWSLSDLSAGSPVSLGDSARVVRPGGYVVVGSDSSLIARFPDVSALPPRLVVVLPMMPGLNNDGDAVVLRDLSGAAIDSLIYDRGWHNPGVIDAQGRSLERINPRMGSTDRRNWSTCARSAGGTPGRVNSIYAATMPAVSRVSASPSPFSPDGDGHEDFTVIHYDLPFPVSMVRIRLFDVRGRMIRTLVNNEPAGSSGDVIWDGRDDARVRARVGVYVVLLEAIDERGGVVEAGKGVVVLAARL